MKQEKLESLATEAYVYVKRLEPLGLLSEDRPTRSATGRRSSPTATTAP